MFVHTTLNSMPFSTFLFISLVGFSVCVMQVLGTLFFLLASVLYQPPPESPQSSCESTDAGGHDSRGGTKELPIKHRPTEIIANPHAKL